MTSFLVLVVVLLVLLIWVVGHLYKRDEKIDPVVKVVQAILTAFAILLAGLWYFVERKGMSHAELTLHASGVRMSESIALVQLRIQIKNIGHTLLRARDWDVRLQVVYPPEIPLKPLIGLNLNHWPEKADSIYAYETQELRWPTISRFHGQDLHEVEPGEMDLKNMDFVVSCESDKVVRATVALKKLDPRWDWESIKKRISGEKPAPLWWKERALLDVASLCQLPVGSAAPLGPKIN